SGATRTPIHPVSHWESIMTMPAVDDSKVTALPLKPGPANVTHISPPPRRINVSALAATIGRNVVPPLLVLLAILAVWQMVFSQPGSSLPPPSEVWVQSYDLIVDPF